jgi:YD repeat-containing protein
VVWVQEDGSETLFTSTQNGYVPPSGCYDQLFLNADGSWTVVRKGGLRYGFSNTGWLQSITDRNGNTTTLSYNSATLLTGVTDASGRSLRLSYDGSGRLASVTDCVGRVWSCQYDASNRLDTLVWPSLNGTLYAELFGYDASNNLTAYTDRLNRSWNYSYTNNGIVTGEVNPLGAHSGSGSYRTIAVQSQTSPQVISSSSSWPSGTVVVGSWTDANNNTTQYGMDGQGQVLGVVDALGNQTNFSYDSNHNRLSTTVPSGSVWQWQYDSRGNVLVSQDPLGNATQTAYGVFDLPVSVTDALGYKTLYSLDSSTGNLLSLTDALGNVSRYSYNTDGSVASATDATGRTSQFGYDQWGHLSSVTDPLGNLTRFSYSADSLLQQRTDALGRVTQYSYDGWGRLVSISYPTSGAPGISYSWDAAGQLIQSSDSTGVRSYTYDLLGRKVKAVDPRGTTQAGYDGVGNVLTQTDVTGRVLSNSYDAAYRLVSVVDGSDNAQVSLSYTVDGQVSSVMYPNGVQVQYGYDAAGRMVSVRHVLVSTNTVLVSYAASYDALGRVVQVVEEPSGDTTVYQYDAVGNLLSEQRSGSRSYSGSYSYDGSHRRLSAKVVVNGVVVHNGSYSYDGGGRLAQVVDGATNQTEVYGWNEGEGVGLEDGTLASAPGPGYTRGFVWNEEGQLVGIERAQRGIGVPIRLRCGREPTLAEGLGEQRMGMVPVRSGL